MVQEKREAVEKIDLTVLKRLVYAKKIYLHIKEHSVRTKVLDRILAVLEYKNVLELLSKSLWSYFNLKEKKETMSFEESLRVLNKVYNKNLKKELPLRKEIIALVNRVDKILKTGILPPFDEIQNFDRYTEHFISEILADVFHIDLNQLNLHFLIENKQVRSSLDEALNALNNGNYKQTIKKSALAFTLALETKRLELNYLKEAEFEDISSILFPSDSPKTLGFKLQDYSFILLALGTDIEKFDKFQEMTPVVILSTNPNNEPIINMGDYVNEKYQNKEAAEFCYDFVLESILNWELTGITR